MIDWLVWVHEENLVVVIVFGRSSMPNEEEYMLLEYGFIGYMF